MADEIALLRTGVDAWRDRALKAEARLAGMEKALDGVEPFVSKIVARLAEAEALLRRVVGAMPDRCADLLMCEVDDFLRADSATHRENERG